MRSRILRLMTSAALLSVLALAGTMSVMPAMCVKGQQGNAKESRSREGKLEGTWRVQVSRRNCQTGAELGPPMPALLTFAEGGTLTETTTVFPPAVRSPGHGFWDRSGRQTYTAVSEAFLFNPSAPPASTWIGTQRLTQTIRLADHSDEFYSTASVEFFGPDGSPIPGFPPTGCATAVARRME